MFDLRYHVASLAAVFVALIIGILVGVGISGRGVLGNPERSLLNGRIADLQGKVDAAGEHIAGLSAAERASVEFVQTAYGAVMADRLAGRRVAVLFVGPVDGSIRTAVEQTLEDGGAQLVRFRAIRMPPTTASVVSALKGQPGLAPYAHAGRFSALGRALGREFVAGGATPFWDALAGGFVEEQSGARRPPADAVVVVRTVPPQTGAKGALLSGLYAGLGDQGSPAVGVEQSSSSPSAVAAFRRSGISSVDDIDQTVGRVALAVVLSGGRRGHYGLKRTADGGILPPVEPVKRPPGPNRGG